MKDSVTQSIDLETVKIDFLNQMVKTYGLTDIAKAIRCLVNYARENPDKHEAIFADVRCLDC